MTINAAIKDLLNNSKPGDEILVASQQEYYNGAPVDEHGNSKLFKETIDVINDNGKLVILIK